MKKMIRKLSIHIIPGHYSPPDEISQETPMKYRFRPKKKYVLKREDGQIQKGGKNGRRGRGTKGTCTKSFHV